MFAKNNYAQVVYDPFVINQAEITTTGRLIITPRVSLFKTQNDIDVDSLSTEIFQQQFEKAPNKKVVFLQYDKYPFYWFRIIIKNTDSLPGDLMLLMAPVGMREGKLFQRKNGRWEVTGRNGYIVPFSDRPYLYSHYVFPLKTAAQETDTIYLSMNANYSFKSFGFVLITPSDLKLLGNKVYFSFGIIVGLLSLFLLINFYLYFTWNDKIQLWYTLYIAMLILIVIKNDQLDQEFFGWDTERAYFMSSIMGIGAIGIAILMHVIQLFLVNIKKTSYLYRISFIVKLNVLASGLTHMVTFYINIDPDIQNVIFEWARTSTTIGILIIITDCLYSIYKGNKSAYFFLAGLLVFLIGAIQRLETIDTSSYFYPPYIFHQGMVIETLIISFGLIYRYRLERKKTYLHQKEKENLLNNMEKLLLESKIEIQEQTLKIVFREINNNVGQKINSVRENLATLRSTNYANADDQLTEAKGAITNSIVELRNLCKGLDTDYIRDIGLLRSIEGEIDEGRRSGLCNSILTTTGVPYRIDPHKELILFRIYQEIFNNLNDFERGNLIEVNLYYQEHSLEIVIAYNRRTANRSSLDKPGYQGNLDTFNLRNKAILIGASFSLYTTSNQEVITIKLAV